MYNPTAAQRMVNRIMDAVDQLELCSGLGPPLSSITDTDTDYCYLVTGNYMTFYRVFGNDVCVDRILYGRRDYLGILLGEVPDEESPLGVQRNRLFRRPSSCTPNQIHIKTMERPEILRFQNFLVKISGIEPLTS